MTTDPTGLALRMLLSPSTHGLQVNGLDSCPLHLFLSFHFVALLKCLLCPNLFTFTYPHSVPLRQLYLLVTSLGFLFFFTWRECCICMRGLTKCCPQRKHSQPCPLWNVCDGISGLPVMMMVQSRQPPFIYPLYVCLHVVFNQHQMADVSTPHRAEL